MAAVHPPPDFKEFLKLLNVHQVEYLLVGGYAVSVNQRKLWEKTPKRKLYQPNTKPC
jgi:hypothetical protein